MPRSFKCELEGDRVIDFVTGEFQVWLDKVCEWHHVQLLYRLRTVARTQEARNKLVFAFGVAKSVIVTEATMRDHEHLVLPLRAWGVAHNKTAVALRSCAECILQFLQLSVEERAAAHPMTKQFFEPGNAGFNEVVLH